MAEMRFSCPHCAQPMTGDAEWAGRQIECPRCKTMIKVPEAPALSAPATSSVPPPLADRPPGKSPALPPPIPRASSHPARAQLAPLALGSLVLSISTIPLNLLAKAVHFPIGLVGCIGGVICGHVALAQIRRDPLRKGRGLAVAGLIIGYLCLLVAAIALGILAVKKGTEIANRSTPRAEGSRSHQRPSVDPVRRPSSVPSPSPGTSRNLTQSWTGSASVTGIIGSTEVRLTKATLSGTTLTLESEAARAGSRDRVILFLFSPESELQSGKTWVVPNPTARTLPHVHFYSATGSGVASRDYTMRLEIGALSEAEAPGKIDLEIQGAKPVRLSGTFELRRP